MAVSPDRTGRTDRTTAPAPRASDDPHAPLRRDVRLLGDLLGATLREQGGEELLATVEAIRRDAKAGRAGDGSAAMRLQERLARLDLAHAVPVARAFAHFLTLANIAEQHHRIRRRRDHARDPRSGPQRASLTETMQRLDAAGVTPAEIQRLLDRMDIELVLTAHPTETTRRTLIAKHQRIAALLAEQDRPDLTPDEQDEVQAALHREITAMWCTDELRAQRPTPEDEARGGFAVIEHVLWEAIPRHLRELDRAVQRHCGQRLGSYRAPIRIGSWMGGDRDGNPNVTHETTRRVVLLARWMAIDLYLRDVHALRQELSMTHASATLHERLQTLHLEADGAEPEPYRVLLRHLRDRLVDHQQRVERMLDDAEHHDEEALTYDIGPDLRSLYESLHETGQARIADGTLLDTLRRHACFGMHLVRLDVRQDAGRHTAAVRHVLRHLAGENTARPSTEGPPNGRAGATLAGLATGVDPNDPKEEPARPPLDRSTLLDLILRVGRREVALPAWEEIVSDADDEVREVLATVRTLARLPRGSFGAYVISMATTPEDVLHVHLLQAIAGVRQPLPVVPLFETRADLLGAADTVGALLGEPAYLRLIDDRLQVMVGYSDSAKDAGVMAAAWGLYTAQERLVEIVRRHGVELTIFHGRGGSVGRGGGPAHAAILALPPGAVDGRLRVTEQGEVIQARFGLPGIALRSLELYVSAVLEATLIPSPTPKEAWRRRMDEMADLSARAYRQMIQDPGFVPYFRTATPEQELGYLKIGSRPARRGKTEGLNSLRAIPWVFAWMQNRLLFPGWAGVGEALAAAQDDGSEGSGAQLSEMVREWPFFHAFLDLVEMGLAKADPWIARRYHEALVPDELKPLGEHLMAKLDETKSAVLATKGHARPLEHDAVLRRSIDVRNPYVDPINLLQIALLERARRDDDPRLRDAIGTTINGIAQGMRNTG